LSWKTLRAPRFLGGVGLGAALAIAAIVATNATGGGRSLVTAGINGLDYAPPDMVLYNGKIATQDAKRHVVQAIAIRDGEVLATGTNDQMKALAGKHTRSIDLGGRTVLPGLLDGHLHGLRNGYACFTQSPRIDNVYDRTDALKQFAFKAKYVKPGSWVWITSGWNINQFGQRGMFTQAELDAAFPGNPVDIRAAGFTGSAANSMTLKVLGLTTNSPGVALSSTGVLSLTGAAQQAADSNIIAQNNAQSIGTQEQCLADFVREANANGLTGWYDSAGNASPFDPNGGCTESLQGSHDHQAVLDLWLHHDLNARVDFEVMNSYSGYQQLIKDQRHETSFLGDDMLREAGIGEEVECPGNTPLVGSSPGDTKTPGVADLATDYSSLVTFLASNHMGFQHHASSKAAQDSELSFWAQANRIYPIKDLRWTIAHPGDDGVSPTPDTLAVAKSLGIGMVPGDAGMLGTGTARALIGNIQRAGVHLCLGTDAMNVAPYPPFGDLAYAITGETQDPNSVGIAVDQRLTRQEALDDKTLQCAWQFMQDGRLGQLTPGAHADLIVLDQDYFTVPNHSIRDIRSLLTLVNGKVVWGSPKGPWASMDPCYSAMGGQKWVDESKDTGAMDMHSCKATPTPSG
jgi:predicted amidohydrolase YtcJ